MSMSRENTMVKIARHGSCIELSTYSRKFGKHGRFMIVADTLAEYFNGPEKQKRPFFDTDCGNIVEIFFRRGKCVIEFTWLSCWGNGHVEGIRERVAIPTDDMIDFMIYENHEKKFLSEEEMGEGSLEFTEGAMRNIGNLTRRQRRAFSKAMSKGALQWPETNVRVWADGRNNFYFGTDDGLCGGLILHDYDGKCRYSVHT